MFNCCTKCYTKKERPVAKDFKDFSDDEIENVLYQIGWYPSYEAKANKNPALSRVLNGLIRVESFKKFIDNNSTKNVSSV
ncbi:hypothetical protein [Candidatus Mesenet endosymbiont of Agriotes lineatus]|uniref:hypothetical protein n=1 Tax=Candidatus Mesenet endosymbiont of Agriotes lineatus TaxID=3077948 RepID=UPI0030D28964